MVLFIFGTGKVGTNFKKFTEQVFMNHKKSLYVYFQLHLTNLVVVFLCQMQVISLKYTEKHIQGYVFSDF